MFEVNRRSFLKTSGGALVAAFLPFGGKLNPHWKSDDDLIRLAGTKRGLAFKCLLVDNIREFNQPAPMYECMSNSLALGFRSPSVQLIREPTIKDIVKDRKYTGPSQAYTSSDGILYPNNILVPSVLFSSIEQDSKKAIQSILKAHDISFIDMLHQAKLYEHTAFILGKEFTIGGINDGFSRVEQWDLLVSTMIMHPETAIWLKNYVYDKRNVVDMPRAFLEAAAEAQTPMAIGHQWSADIFVSDLMPKHRIFATSPADYLGVVPIEHPSQLGKQINEDLGGNKFLLSGYDGKTLRHAPIYQNGKHIAMVTGMSIVNDKGISCIELTTDLTKYALYVSAREREKKIKQEMWSAHCRDMARRGVFYKSGTVKPGDIV